MASPPAHSETETRAALGQVTVVVVTYNSAHCLESLGNALRHCPHVIVVDNGSEDGCPENVERHLPHATLLASPINLGFGAANNRALAVVGTPFALLLNPDCEITSETIAGLVETARSLPDCAIVAPQLTDAANQPEINYRWPSVYWNSQGAGADGLACVGFVCGAAMLFQMSNFADTGFFDERFFLYYEDDDLCLRLFQAGKSMVINPALRALHRSRGSVRGKNPWRSEYLRGYHHAQSKLIFAAKHLPVGQDQRLRKKLIAATLLSLPLRLLLISPRLSARMVGRLRGACDWKPHG